MIRKVLITCFEIQDLGGIINHTERLASGFRDIGVQPEFCYLHPRSNRAHYPASIEDEEWVPSQAFPFSVSQDKGWAGAPRYAYDTAAHVDEFRHYADGFDLVIHTVAVPSLRTSRGMGMDWLGLYDLDVRQLFVCHDGGFRNTSMHLLAVPQARKVVCVHSRTVESLHGSGFITRYIPIPQDIDRRKPARFSKRLAAWVAPHTFKTWKHMHDLIASCRWQGRDVGKYVLGDGIERRYMTSQDKCNRDRYWHADIGRKVWDVALEAGMEYYGYQPTSVVIEDFLRCCAVMVDPSYQKGFPPGTGQINTVLFEAMVHGAIPFAHKEFCGLTPLKPGTHYMDLPFDPKEMAEVLEAACYHVHDADDIIIQNRKWVKRHLGRKKIAAEFLDFAMEDDYGELVNYDERIFSRMKNECDKNCAKLEGS